MSTGRLRRSQSTRSIRRGCAGSMAVEPFDPNIARLHATMAASLAMSRSTDRGSTLSEGSYERLGGPCSMAVPPRRHMSTISRYISDHSSGVEELPSSHPRAYPAETSHTDQNWSALPSINEFGGLNHGIASQPSSYRRLRKTRSMFSARQRPSHAPNGSPPPSGHTPTAAVKSPTSDAPKSYRSLRHSMSFLRGDAKHPSALRHAKSHDVAIQLARCQYQQKMHDYASPQLPPLPIPKARREHKPFRKTFRSSSTSGNDVPASSPLTERPSYISTFGKTRSFSHSIKKGFKRVFGISKPPPQQTPIQGGLSPYHNRKNVPSTVVTQIEEDEPAECRGYQSPDRANRQGGLHQQLTLRSKPSCESLATSRSRVTSWADSSVENTITTPKAGSQRLSIIDEQYIPTQDHTEDLHSNITPLRPGESIDSQRLFSALMKRIERGNTQSPNEDVVLGRVKEHRPVHTRGSLHGRGITQTIRQVSSNESIPSPKSFATANAGPATPRSHAQYAGGQQNTVKVSRGPNRICLQCHSPDDDSKSVIVCKGELDSDSPSVYSRTTGGNSPKLQTSTNSPEHEEELGVATIFASERTTYSSPNRALSSSGADWQHWVDSQMERIENLTPTKHHYREDAQIEDDYGTAFSYSIPPRKTRAYSKPVEPSESNDEGLTRKASASSNFSRPFGRTSSVGTVVTVPKQRLVSTPPSSTPTPRPVSNCPTEQGYSVISTRTRINISRMTPMQPRPSNKLRGHESPTPKRDTTDASPKMHIGTQEPYLPKWPSVSQDLGVSQLRNARLRRDNRRATNENLRLERGQYIQPRDLQSPISSKRMVEMFLNSRRRRMGSEMSDDGSSEAAFI